MKDHADKSYLQYTEAERRAIRAEEIKREMGDRYLLHPQSTFQYEPSLQVPESPRRYLFSIDRHIFTEAVSIY